MQAKSRRWRIRARGAFCYELGPNWTEVQKYFVCNDMVSADGLEPSTHALKV